MRRAPQWTPETTVDGDDRETLSIEIVGCMTDVGDVTRVASGEWSWALRLGDDTQTCDVEPTLERAKEALLAVLRKALLDAGSSLSKGPTREQLTARDRGEARERAAREAAGLARSCE